MSLAKIQSVVLRMLVDPRYATTVYQEGSDSDEVIQKARQIPQEVLESFQIVVALKRISTSIGSMLRFWEGIPEQKRTEILRSFITEHVMNENEWASKVPEFLQYLTARLDDSIEEQVIKEMIAFERWAYNSSTRQEDIQGPEDGYHIATHVKVSTYQLPADYLISKPPLHDQELFKSLVNSYGTRSYLLAMHNELEADLFEIDELYYEFLTQVQTNCRYEELLNLADKLLAQFHVTGKTSTELVEEFMDQGILVQTNQEAVVWRVE